MRLKYHINVRIGNGSSCNVWFDKWNSNGPLSKLIDQRTIIQFGFSLKDKVCDLIQNRIWSWPGEWEGRFSTVLDVPVPVINHNVDDKVYWVNKKGKEKGFSVAEVWKAIKPEFPKERNSRIFQQMDRSEDSLFEVVVSTVRLRLRSLKLKQTPDVIDASEI
ncbi:hypothetical protein Tco_0676411 [Tanacetum coccineum]